MRNIKVLLLDDSLISREYIYKELERDINIHVVAKASNIYEARDKIVALRPNIMVSDVHIGQVSGLEFAKQLLPQYYMPVIAVSSDYTYKDIAESVNGVSFVSKPASIGNGLESDLFCRRLIAKIKSIANNDEPGIDTEKTYSKLITIGASTGGAETLEAVLSGLPPVLPPIVISQHMPPLFTRSFADRLNGKLKLSIKEAENGDLLIPGQVYIAPGGYHTTVVKRDKRYQLSLELNDSGSKLCPSVDKMFCSVADAAGEDAVGIILTGMGKDGAAGLLAIRNAGGHTIGQDEQSSIIYGMPKAAFDLGAVEMQLPLERISNRIVSLCL